MTPMEQMVIDLQEHLAVSRELLDLLERESCVLRGEQEYSAAVFSEERKKLLPRLDRSTGFLKKHRIEWQTLTPEQRQTFPEVASLLQLNQDVAMKILVLDRENEQALLRRGLLPAGQLPSAERQRPHFVADLYRRHNRF